ncbi:MULTISPECIES: hypothetical protein [unclassified Corallococcus]|uniref:hypothetical protein n=1 Tax=unclassified Corallococcus TaxID=2685029 RepID=UPI001A906F19|nr:MULTISPECIES: hypothetical protein [unclassified Corallococcus]MBN9685383.1 hypothetical protein [Corallococcus sp. NCSPR001]WAS83166.1 hypothetical protein O0N60_28075 [Corallococcus sp. NCRR]
MTTQRCEFVRNGERCRRRGIRRVQARWFCPGCAGRGAAQLLTLTKKKHAHAQAAARKERET